MEIKKELRKDFLPPKILKKETLPLPKKSVEPFSEGSIFLYEIVVTEEGKACGVRLVRAPKITPSWPEIIEIHKRALCRWKFEPGKEGGKPVAMRITVAVRIQFK